MRTLHVGQTTITAEVVDTEPLREQGLSGRDALAQDSGMLFVFDRPDVWGIWMKDMRFSLDIVWLNEAGKVITLKQNVAPDTYPEAFYPASPALYVVELPAGWAAARGVAEGSQFVL